MSYHDTILDELSPEKRQVLSDVLEHGIDVKWQLLQHHAEMARLLAREIMEEEVVGLAGERYSRDKPNGGRYSRWGCNPGSIAVGEERAPIQVPRVRDQLAGHERPLESYRRMREPMTVDDQLQRAILLGLSQRDYEEVASRFADGFGLSQSTVSRRFQERSRQVLEEFESRTFDDDFVGLWIDGKHLAKEQIVICLGLTLDGRKLPLGFVETTTENGAAVKELLRDVVERGLRFEQGLFCVIDGAKGLYKAVRDVFGPYAFVQRCQWHKRENVTSYLTKSDGQRYGRRLQKAYDRPTYAEAKEELLNIHAELETVNRSAARSLMEGLEETLTLHRLGLFPELGKSLKTTNCNRVCQQPTYEVHRQGQAVDAQRPAATLGRRGPHGDRTQRHRGQESAPCRQLPETPAATPSHAPTHRRKTATNLRRRTLCRTHFQLDLHQGHGMYAGRLAA